MPPPLGEGGLTTLQTSCGSFVLTQGIMREKSGTEWFIIRASRRRSAELAADCCECRNGNAIHYRHARACPAHCNGRSSASRIIGRKHQRRTFFFPPSYFSVFFLYTYLLRLVGPFRAAAQCLDLLFQSRRA